MTMLTSDDADPWIGVADHVMAGLSVGDFTSRQKAAMALLRLYEHGSPSPAVRQRILRAGHCVTSHYDNTTSNDCHTLSDEGAGLPGESLARFPRFGRDLREHEHDRRG